VITAEQIAAVDRAIVRLTHENPGCRLHVDLETIVVDTEDEDVLLYDVYHEEYKEESCERCGEWRAPADMGVNGKCFYCEDDASWDKAHEKEAEHVSA